LIFGYLGFKIPSLKITCGSLADRFPSGAITLGQVADRLPLLEVSCDRRDRLRTARLPTEHGPDMPIPTLLRIVAADCPRGCRPNGCMTCAGCIFPGLARVSSPATNRAFRLI
jgi:hypothetical protein